MISFREIGDIRQRARVCSSKVCLDGKTVVITGGNAGIGKVSAIDFAKRGARVVICSRNETKAEAAVNDIKEASGSKNVDYYLMDLMSLQSVREAAANILNGESRIDILLNNAGIMDVPFAKTVDGFESQFATNYLGHFLFTLLLLNRIKESDHARIINVSSMAHRFGRIKFNNLNGEKSYNSWFAYCNSKLANIIFTRELSRRLEGTNVHVYCLHPGVIDTGLMANINERGGIKKWFSKVMLRTVGKTEDQGAQTQIHCAVDEKAGLENGLYYVNCRPNKPLGTALDKQIAKKLWEVSLQMVSLNEYSLV